VINPAKAARLQLNTLVNTADVFDLSSSISDSGIEQRLLIGWWTKHVSLHAVTDFASFYGMPAVMIERWLENANNSDGVGLAVNKNLTSLRLYTHHWNEVDPSNIGAIVYRGYKVLPDGTFRVDEYRHMGDLRDPENLQFAIDNSRHPDWLTRVLQNAPINLPLLFARIQNSGRQSWIATVRHANVDAGGVLQQRLNGQKLLHLAGGIDATKGAFDTFYVNAGFEEARKFLSG